jgi:6-phosphogluconolactonase
MSLPSCNSRPIKATHLGMLLISIAGFAVDTTGRLTAIGHVSTEPVPSNLSLDPAGRFIFAAGSESGRLASYRINNETGALTPLATYAVGRRPMGVLAIRLGD